MSNIYNSIEQLIGNTPMLRLCGLEKKYGLKANVYAKLEYLNPAGSVKDRVGKAILDDALQKGILKEDSGIAAVAAVRGYRTIIVMPETMSEERRKLIKAYGAELVLTDGKKGMNGAIEKAEQLKEEIPNSFIAGQFVNSANPKVHYDTTGPEIYNDLDGKIDIFVAGVGTGGTISGCGKYLKEKCESVKIVAVEPSASPVLSGGNAGSHAIQGIGAGFVPEVLDTSVIDEILMIDNDDALETARQMGKTEGFLVGISSGAAIKAAITLAQREENKDKNIVVVLADSGSRYLSTNLY